MLRIEFIGNLGADPEQRFTAKGDPQVTFRVAVNSRRQDTEGEWQDRTDWFRVRTMGWRAEQARKLSKGDKVFVTGSLDIGEYQARTGEQRTSLDVWADHLESLTPRPRDESDGVAAGGRPGGASGTQGASRPTDAP
jgi:single-strand DNA-binding protein